VSVTVFESWKMDAAVRQCYLWAALALLTFLNFAAQAAFRAWDGRAGWIDVAALIVLVALWAVLLSRSRPLLDDLAFRYRRKFWDTVHLTDTDWNCLVSGPGRDDIVLAPEVKEWCEQNLKRKFVHYHVYNIDVDDVCTFSNLIVFRSPDDALMFKLAWITR